MLIKKLLTPLPLSPAPKPRKGVPCTAGAAVHDLGRCGQVLAVDVYEHGTLMFRFFSDGKNYITWIDRPFKGITEQGWTKRDPFGGVYGSHPDIIASPADMDKIHAVLHTQDRYYSEHQKVSETISHFISNIGWEKRCRAWDAKERLKKEHFAMFPDYPADLASFCEKHLFQQSVVYVSKLVKGQRQAQCRHCGKSFQVGREIKPGTEGFCPACGRPVSYRAEWVAKEVTHRARVCIAHRVEGKLLLRYVDVDRTIYPNRPAPEYYFSDYFKTLFLTSRGKPTEYVYAWCQAPYQGYDWRRLPNDTGNLDSTYVYTSNLREVFGGNFCYVDLQAGLFRFVVIIP